MRVACFLLLLGISRVSFAQSNYATLVGTIYDPQSKAVPGATIQITSSGTRASRKVTSNDLGIFRITGLLPDEYELEVTASGFASVKQTLRLEVGQQLTLDFNLKLDSVATTIEVGAVEPCLAKIPFAPITRDDPFLMTDRGRLIAG
jgi:hypothetical protein